MARGDLGEFFVGISDKLQQRNLAAQNQSLQQEHANLYRAQTANYLQKADDERATQSVLSEVSQANSGLPQHELYDLASKKLMDKGYHRPALAFGEKAALERNRVRDDLRTNIKWMVDNDYTDAANALISKPENKKLYGDLPDDFQFLPGGQEVQATLRPTADKPFIHPITKEKVDKGVWKIKQNRRGDITVADEIADKESKAPTSPFQSYRAGEIAKGNTDESKIASGWQQKSKELAREGGRNIPMKRICSWLQRQQGWMQKR